MVKEQKLNVTALVRLLHHVENVAETRLTGTSADTANWLTLINASLRAAVTETEMAARRLNESRANGNNRIQNNNIITI